MSEVQGEMTYPRHKSGKLSIEDTSTPQGK